MKLFGSECSCGPTCYCPGVLVQSPRLQVTHLPLSTSPKLCSYLHIYPLLCGPWTLLRLSSLPLLYPLWSLSLLGVFPSFSSKGFPYTYHLAQSSPSFLSWSVCSLGWSTYSEVRSYQLTVASGTIRKRSMVGFRVAEEATVSSEEIVYSEEGPEQAPGRERPLK